ncbi:hypothetical protein [Shimia abyssi]|uniref:Uncharacterized protein n=1 Tax=Shimia abyssi TaxID=1662395 RepID=A0A2P8FB11_9RHOB|nr:hypothetical protein [Shimia abyssi]PSL18923.1 hypothetical protein CLV88_108101 [Shimia abyssi]
MFDADFMVSEGFSQIEPASIVAVLETAKRNRSVIHLALVTSLPAQNQMATKSQRIKVPELLLSF